MNDKAFVYKFEKVLEVNRGLRHSIEQREYRVGELIWFLARDGHTAEEYQKIYVCIGENLFVRARDDH